MNWDDILVAHGLSIGTMLVGCAVAWGKIHERIRTNRERIEDLEQRCDHYDDFAERFATISTDIKWIKETLRDAGGVGNRRGDGRRDPAD